MRRLLPLTALLVLASAAPAHADINLGSGARPQAIATGDFNSDGRQDLAIADISSSGKRVFVRLGNGDGTFRGEGSLESQPLPEDLAVADITGDGNEDLVIAARHGSDKDIAYAHGAGLTLTTRPPVQPAPPPAFGPDTRVTIALAARRAPVRVRVVNRNAFAVSGTLRGRRFAVAAGGRATVRLPLRKAQRRRLQRKGRVALRLAAVVTDPAGNRRTVSRRVSVRRFS